MSNILTDGTVYVAGDRFVCSSISCAGSTAAASGVDIDGNRLRKVDEIDIAEWATYDLGPLHCECGKVVAS